MRGPRCPAHFYLSALRAVLQTAREQYSRAWEDIVHRGREPKKEDKEIHKSLALRSACRPCSLSPARRFLASSPIIPRAPGATPSPHGGACCHLFSSPAVSCTLQSSRVFHEPRDGKGKQRVNERRRKGEERGKRKEEQRGRKRQKRGRKSPAPAGSCQLSFNVFFAGPL